MDISRVEEILGYRFKDRRLLIAALTHSSYANEYGEKSLASSERLEFLGDSVLGTAVSDILYRNYPERSEGDLSKMRAAVVREDTLGLTALSLALNEFLLLGRGEEAAGGRGRISINADMLESVIGAVYLDGGFGEAEALVERLIGGAIEDAVSEKLLGRDSKTALQELLQRDGAIDIGYEIVSEAGPDHEKIFEAVVICGGKILGRGSGSSKKRAEAEAAEDALRRLGG